MWCIYRRWQARIFGKSDLVQVYHDEETAKKELELYRKYGADDFTYELVNTETASK